MIKLNNYYWNYS